METGIIRKKKHPAFETEVWVVEKDNIDYVVCYKRNDDDDLIQYLEENEGNEVKFSYFPDPYCQCSFANIII